MDAGGGRLGSPLAWATAAGWALVAALWLLDALGRGAPVGLSRALVAGAAAALGLLLFRSARRLWRRQTDPRGRLLLGLLALALCLHFAGLEHEIGGRYFGDEGIYLAQANRINDGRQLVRPWFIYPHLLFYLDAVALWIAGLGGPLVPVLARLLYGVEGELAVAALVTRWVTATLGALTVVPVWWLARRIAGPASPAPALAGAATVLAPLYLEVAHLNIADVPAAFFATLALAQAASLLDRERRRDYLLGGVWAGLAAGSKYPAGLVAVALAALWLRWRLRQRRWGGGLLWAALAAMAAFLATTPSLLAFPERALAGGADLLFGFRQYALQGWTGVVRASNSLYYLDRLRLTFGLPLLLVGTAGLAMVGGRTRRRLAWMLPFPAAYLALLLAMQIAVPRNLLPVLPALAAVLGLGAGGWLSWSRERRPRLQPLAAVVVTACLALPAARAGALVLTIARPTTRDEAAAWVTANLPPGAFIVQEAYTPQLPPDRFPARKPRFAARLALAELADPRHDFLFLASESYDRFLHPRNLDDPGLAHFAARYREIFARFELVREWRPGRFQAGPALRLYRLDPAPSDYRTERSFAAAEALLADGGMAGAEGRVDYAAAGQWSLFKAHLAGGRFQVDLEAELTGGGRLRAVTREGREVADLPLTAGAPPAELDLPHGAKYFLYLHLAPGSRLRGLRLERLPEVAAAGRG